MQQHVAADVTRGAGWPRAAQQQRAAHRHQALFEQEIGREPRAEWGAAVPHRQVHRLGLKVRQVLGRQDPQINPRVKARVVRQPWDEPLGGEGRSDADRHMQGLGPQALCGIGEHLERAPHAGGIALAVVGQHQGARVPLEQLEAQLCFERTNLLRHGALGHAQLQPGQAKVEMAAGGLERSQRIERGRGAQRGGHGCRFSTESKHGGCSVRSSNTRMMRNNCQVPVCGIQGRSWQ